MDDVLVAVERYLDGVPRRHARVEDVGPFTVFLGDPQGWTFCARPRLGRNRGFDVPSLSSALARLAEAGLPPVLEWVHESAPALLDVVRADGGLGVEEIPLLVLGDLRPPRPLPPGVTVRVLDPATSSDVGALAQARAVTRLAFDTGGTDAGEAGTSERDELVEPVPPPLVEAVRRGDAVWAVAEDRERGVLACGRHLPLGGTTEVAGVATLPAARRPGLGAAVTVALVEDARDRGVETVFLTASSARVASLYEGLGFLPVGTGYVAERR